MMTVCQNNEKFGSKLRHTPALARRSPARHCELTRQNSYEALGGRSVAIQSALVRKNSAKSFGGFTIVELLVVIVVIGILAAITLVTYSAITQKAVVASLQSDLSNADKILKIFQAEKDAYPTTIDCTQADSGTNKCVKYSTGNSLYYQYDNTVNPKTFCLMGRNGDSLYSVSSSGGLTSRACPITGLVTDGLVFSLDAGDNSSYSGTGTNWADLTGNNYSGTLLNGPSFSNANGGTLHFDKIDDAVSIPNGISYAQGFSISAWVYPLSAGEGPYGRIFDKSNSTNSSTGLYLYMNGGTYVCFAINNVGGVVSNTNAVPYNKWTFVTATVDSTGAAKLSFNGVLANSGTIGAPSGITTTNPLTIGNRSAAADRTFDGNISYAQFYSRVLSQTEILQNFNAMKARYGL